MTHWMPPPSTPTPSPRLLPPARSPHPFPHLSCLCAGPSVLLPIVQPEVQAVIVNATVAGFPAAADAQAISDVPSGMTEDVDALLEELEQK